jgi:hypothetical protein
MMEIFQITLAFISFQIPLKGSMMREADEHGFLLRGNNYHHWGRTYCKVLECSWLQGLKPVYIAPSLFYNLLTQKLNIQHGHHWLLFGLFASTLVPKLRFNTSLSLQTFVRGLARCISLKES